MLETKNPPHLRGDLILRRVNNLVFSLQVHPRCVSMHTKASLCQGEISFYVCCIAQE